MKKVVFVVGGICAALAAVVMFTAQESKPVEVLAQQLENAWADYRTVV